MSDKTSSIEKEEKQQEEWVQIQNDEEWHKTPSESAFLPGSPPTNQMIKDEECHEVPLESASLPVSPPTNPAIQTNQNASPKQPIIYTINNSTDTKVQPQNDPSQSSNKKHICACCNKQIPEYLLQGDQVFYQKAYSYSFTKNYALRIEEVCEPASTLQKRPNAALFKFNDRNELIPVNCSTNTGNISEKVVKETNKDDTTGLNVSSNRVTSESTDGNANNMGGAIETIGSTDSTTETTVIQSYQYPSESVVTNEAYLKAMKQIEELKIADANLKNAPEESVAQSSESKPAQGTSKKSGNNKKFKLVVKNRFNSLDDN